MSRCPRSGLVLASLLALLTMAPPVTAQTSGAAMAESLFLEARELMAAGNFAAACPKLKQSNELDPQLGTLLNLGKCYEQNGQTASAWATFAELARLAPRAGQVARANYAASRVRELEPQLAYVTVRLATAPPDVTVRIDEEKLSTAVLGSALPVDPGPRVLSVQAPGYAPYSRTLQVSPSSRQLVTVPALRTLAPSPVPQPLAPFEPESSAPWWPLAITGYAVAGVGLTVGSVTGILALDTGGELSCSNGTCPASDRDNLSKATTLANVSNVSFGFAAAGAVLGIVATVMAVSEDDAPAEQREPKVWSFEGGVLRF